MRTGCLLTVSRSSCRGSRYTAPPPPPGWMQTTLEADPWRQNPLDTDPTGGRPPLDADPSWMQTLLDADHPPVNRMTHMCESTTLSETSFVGGNNLHSILNVLPFQSRKNLKKQRWSRLFMFLSYHKQSTGNFCTVSLADIRGDTMDPRSPSLGNFFSFSCNCRQKSYQIIGFHSKLMGCPRLQILGPSPPMFTYRMDVKGFGIHPLLPTK